MTFGKWEGMGWAFILQEPSQLILCSLRLFPVESRDAVFDAVLGSRKGDYNIIIL